MNINPSGSVVAWEAECLTEIVLARMGPRSAATEYSPAWLRGKNYEVGEARLVQMPSAVTRRQAPEGNPNGRDHEA